MSDRTRFDRSELDERALAADEVAILVALGREVRDLDGAPGPISSGFADRVMAALGAEPTPRPSQAAAAALRTHRVRALAGAIADALRVSFGSAARPFGARVAAAPLAIAALLLVGSLAVLGAGAAGLRLPGPSSPLETAPIAAPSIEPSAAPADSPEPSASSIRLASPGPTSSSKPSPSTRETPRPSAQATATAAPTPEPTSRPTPRPTYKPTPTETAEPIDTPRPSSTPEQSDDHGGSSPTPSPSSTDSSGPGGSGSDG